MKTPKLSFIRDISYCLDPTKTTQALLYKTNIPILCNDQIVTSHVIALSYKLSRWHTHSEDLWGKDQSEVFPVLLNESEELAKDIILTIPLKPYHIWKAFNRSRLFNNTNPILSIKAMGWRVTT